MREKVKTFNDIREAEKDKRPKYEELIILRDKLNEQKKLFIPTQEQIIKELADLFKKNMKI